MDQSFLLDLFARYRKGIASAAGMTFLSFLAYLGPTWSVAVAAALTAAAVIVIPNADADGDGEVSIPEVFDYVAEKAVDRAIKAHPAIPYPNTGESVTESIALHPTPIA